MLPNKGDIELKNLLFKNVRNNYKKLLETGEFSDVDIVTKKKVIKAHKNILCSQSTVFRMMLTTEMKEQETGQIKLDDDNTDPDVVENIINFLYTGEINDLETMAGIKLLNLNQK